jgi:hypothetical protein
MKTAGRCRRGFDGRIITNDTPALIAVRNLLLRKLSCCSKIELLAPFTELKLSATSALVRMDR